MAISALLDRFSDLLGRLASALLLALVVLINVEVFLRYLAGRSTLIADEYGGYLLVWITMFGLADALRKGQFIRVEMFVDRQGPRKRAACDALAAIVGLTVALATGYACWLLVAGSWRFGTRSIQPSATPLWTMQMALPLGMALLSLLYLDALAQSVRRLLSRTG